jgi:hypothetical protein
VWSTGLSWRWRQFLQNKLAHPSTVLSSKNGNKNLYWSLKLKLHYSLRGPYSNPVQCLQHCEPPITNFRLPALALIQVLKFSPNDIPNANKEASSWHNSCGHSLKIIFIQHKIKPLCLHTEAEFPTFLVLWLCKLIFTSTLRVTHIIGTLDAGSEDFKKFLELYKLLTIISTWK